MRTARYWFGIVSWVVSGCAAYQLEPLNMSHPANPAALAAPERSVSKTLEYTRADIATLRPVADGAAAQKGGDKPEGGEQKSVTGEGKVVATVPTNGQLVVEHGEIKGFMDSMTMGYRIEPPSLLEGLKPGDAIRFTIDVQKKTIVKIEKLK